MTSLVEFPFDPLPLDVVEVVEVVVVVMTLPQVIKLLSAICGVQFE